MTRNFVSLLIRRLGLLGMLGGGLAAGFLASPRQARAQDSVQAATDNTSYSAGSSVRVKVFLPSSGDGRARPLDLTATVRYAGEGRPVVDNVRLATAFAPSTAEPSTGYVSLWKVPLDARTGLYEVGIEAKDSKTHRIAFQTSNGAAFAVHRKLVRIQSIALARNFYASGDPVAATVMLKNLTYRALAGLQVEFSDRYWPWIGTTAGTDLHITPLAKALLLPPGGRKELSTPQAAVAPAVKQPSVHQYAVTVWDHEHKHVYDIAFSDLVFVYPAGIDSAKPYPSQYAYSNLSAIKFKSYRHFYSSDSPAIQFDRSHTLFASGGEGTVSFSVRDPTPRPWHAVSVRARLVAPGGSTLASNVVAEALDLEPKGSLLNKEIKFAFPAAASGLYRAEVEVSGAAEQILAADSLELGVNPLPKSILVFCAHEDDEGGYAGMIRAAVENHIPIHFLYFTSGDAGSCDRYYQHSCGPAEALNFGALRMDEARAAVGHLGVAREDIYFLGLPDGGLGEIWYQHVKPANPYLDVLLATDHAPYEGLVQTNLAYAREAVVEVVKQFIKRFQPDLIYTAHPPNVQHVDHKVNNYIVVKALQELLREGGVSPQLTLLVDQVYDPKAQPVTPYHYQKYVFTVSGEVMALAQESRWFYQSQGGNQAQANLQTFNQLARTMNFRQLLDWQEHEGWNETIEPSGDGAFH